MACFVRLPYFSSYYKADDESIGIPLEVYQEFTPLVFQQQQHMKLKNFETFDDALDEFFAKSETQKDVLQRQQQEKAAYSKIEKVLRVFLEYVIDRVPLLKPNSMS